MRDPKQFLVAGRRSAVLFVGAAVVLLGISLSAPVRADTSIWRVVSSPNTGGGDDPIAVAATSTSDAWIVGDRFKPSTATYSTLIEHWNGTSWSVVSSPNGGKFNWLYGVAALSATDAWAVGFSNNSTWAANRTLAEHWDGNRWTIVSTPNVGAASSLFGVAAISSNDVWAVGNSYTSAGDSRTLVEHWNGAKWSVVSSPNASSYDSLFGVDADSSGGLWAVGNFVPASGGHDWNTLTERYRTGKWSIVSSPNPNESNFLDRVAAISPWDAWAVGVDYDSAYVSQSLIEHWNGTSWKVVAAPPTGAELRTVTAISSTDVWAVGTNGSKTLTERWNGTAWKVISSPNVGTGFNSLEGVGGIGHTLWAVGTYHTSTGSRTLILRTDQA